MTTPRGYLRSCSVITFYDAGLRQCSLHGWRLELCLRGGSGLLSGWRRFLFSHRRAGFISIPGQVRGFPTEYATGCQPSSTTKSNVVLRKDLHLQARPDYCHGRGAKDAGDVDQSSLSRRLLVGRSSRWLICNSHGRFSTPHSNWGLARQLRHKFFYGGGWAAAGSSRLSHRIPISFVPLFYGVGRWNLLQATEFRRRHTQHRDTSTRLPSSWSLPLGMWSP
jgi:hypothetical protein